MVKVVLDQAEGLRRMLARHATRLVALSGGVPAGGQTTAAVNLAGALAQHGQDVLLLDETGHAAAALGLGVRYDLADVWHQRASLARARIMAPDGFAVLAAAPRRLSGIPPEALLARLDEAKPDVVVIDTAHDAGMPLSALASRSHDIVVMFSPNAASITGAYRWLKQTHLEHAVAQCHVLVNRSEDAEARSVYRNLADTASRYLAVSLTLAGHLPLDKQVLRARQLHRTVVDAFPAAPAAVQFRQLGAAVMRWPLLAGHGDPARRDNGGEFFHSAAAGAAMLQPA